MYPVLPGHDVPVVLLIDAPTAESPTQHVRNSLMLLGLLKDMSPAVWAMNPELAQAQRRAEVAVMLLEHSGSPHCAARHVRRAIEALLAAKLDWEAVDLLPAACSRLFVAWFALDARVETN